MQSTVASLNKHPQDCTVAPHQRPALWNICYLYDKKSAIPKRSCGSCHLSICDAVRCKSCWLRLTHPISTEECTKCLYRPWLLWNISFSSIWTWRARWTPLQLELVHCRIFHDTLFVLILVLLCCYLRGLKLQQITFKEREVSVLTILQLRTTWFFSGCFCLFSAMNSVARAWNRGVLKLAIKQPGSRSSVAVRRRSWYSYDPAKRAFCGSFTGGVQIFKTRRVLVNISDAIFTALLRSLSWAPQLSLGISADADIRCDEAAVIGVTIKWGSCSA